MFKGGYKLIDFKETNITSTETSTIKGVYEAIKNNYRKPTLITGLVIENVEKEDTFVNFEHNTNEYNGLLGITADNKVLFIKIKSDDAVIIEKNTITLA